MEDTVTAKARERAIGWLRGQQAAMESLLGALVEVSSWTHDKPGVDRANAVLRDALPPGLACRTVPSAAYGDHLVIDAPRPASSRGVVLVGHMDTVFPRERFVGYRTEGRIARGPGVLDMKGGLVVVRFALAALEAAGALATTALTWVVVGDEEVGSPDSAALLRDASRGARAALVFESGRPADAIITRRKGTGSASVVAHGKAAHAGNSHAKGANAIWALARFVDRAQGLTDYARGLTVNVGRVQGGMGKNTVPDRAEADVDLRFVTVDDEALLRDALVTAAAEAALPGTRVEIAWGPGRTPLVRTDASAALYEAYARAQRDAGLGETEMALVGGGSDASTTASVGVPSIDGLGPRGRGFHTLDEQVELDTLVPKAEALVRFLLAD